MDQAQARGVGFGVPSDECREFQGDTIAPQGESEDRRRFPRGIRSLGRFIRSSDSSDRTSSFHTFRAHHEEGSNAG